MKNKKQQYGQYFTDNNHVNNIIDVIKKFKEINGDVLEPSFGDGAFIEEFKKYNVNIDAYEIDISIFKDKYKNEKIKLYNDDFIFSRINKKYDFIVGNPPYIELSYSFYNEEQQILLNNKYSTFCEGRVNLAHIFLYECIKLLKNDGILAFLVPSSILTSPYYNKIRTIIHDNCDVLYIKNDVNFKNVAIKVSLIIIKKTKNITNNFIIKYNDNIYLTEDNSLYPDNIISLKDEGFKVSIGEIVWNQHKDKLYRNKTNNLKTIIYSTFIREDSLNIRDINNDEKKSYISWNNIKHKNCIIIPRTISKKINFYYIKDNNEYVFENHVLVITNNDLNKLDKLYNKFKNGDYDKYINLYFNSSNLSAREVLDLPFEEIYK